MWLNSHSYIQKTMLTSSGKCYRLVTPQRTITTSIPPTVYFRRIRVFRKIKRTPKNSCAKPTDNHVVWNSDIHTFTTDTFRDTSGQVFFPRNYIHSTHKESVKIFSEAYGHPKSATNCRTPAPYTQPYDNYNWFHRSITERVSVAIIIYEDKHRYEHLHRFKKLISQTL